MRSSWTADRLRRSARLVRHDRVASTIPSRATCPCSRKRQSSSATRRCAIGGRWVGASRTRICRGTTFRHGRHRSTVVVTSDGHPRDPRGRLLRGRAHLGGRVVDEVVTEVRVPGLRRARRLRLPTSRASRGQLSDRQRRRHRAGCVACRPCGDRWRRGTPGARRRERERRCHGAGRERGCRGGGIRRVRRAFADLSGDSEYRQAMAGVYAGRAVDAAAALGRPRATTAAPTRSQTSGGRHAHTRRRDSISRIPRVRPMSTRGCSSPDTLCATSSGSPDAHRVRHRQLRRLHGHLRA